MALRCAASAFSWAMSSDVSTDFLSPERKRAQKVRASATADDSASRRARGAENGTSITEELVVRVSDDADLRDRRVVVKAPGATVYLG